MGSSDGVGVSSERGRRSEGGFLKLWGGQTVSELGSSILLFVTAFVSGILTVFFDVAYLSYVPSLAGRDRLSDANAGLQMSMSLAQVAGPGLPGLLVQLLGAARAIAADSASFLASARAVLWIRSRRTGPTPQSGGALRGSSLTACGSSRRIAACHGVRDDHDLRPQDVVWGAIPLGSIVGGALASASGMVAAFEAGAAIGVTGATALFISPVGRLRDYPRPTDTIGPQPT